MSKTKKPGFPATTKSTPVMNKGYKASAAMPANKEDEYELPLDRSAWAYAGASIGSLVLLYGLVMYFMF